MLGDPLVHLVKSCQFRGWFLALRFVFVKFCVFANKYLNNLTTTRKTDPKSRSSSFLQNLFRTYCQTSQQYENIIQNLSKMMPGSGLGKAFGAGRSQERDKRGPSLRKGCHFGATWRILGAMLGQLAPNGGPRDPKWHQKSIKNRSQNLCKIRCRKRLNNDATMVKTWSQND